MDRVTRLVDCNYYVWTVTRAVTTIMHHEKDCFYALTTFKISLQQCDPNIQYLNDSCVHFVSSGMCFKLHLVVMRTLKFVVQLHRDRTSGQHYK